MPPRHMGNRKLSLFIGLVHLKYKDQHRIDLPASLFEYTIEQKRHLKLINYWV